VPSGATDAMGTPGAKIDTLEASVRTTLPVRAEITTNRNVDVHPTTSAGMAGASAARALPA
jgi:hypothetical protein